MNDEEWLAGRNAVIEGLRSSQSIQKIWVADGVKKASIQETITRAKEQNIVIQTVPKKKLDALIGHQNHQGIIASIAAHAYADIETLFSAASNRGQAPFFILCDGIEDPQNLGSILRTADAAGAHGVIIPKRGRAV